MTEILVLRAPRLLATGTGPARPPVTSSIGPIRCAQAAVHSGTGAREVEALSTDGEHGSRGHVGYVASALRFSWPALSASDAQRHRRRDPALGRQVGNRQLLRRLACLRSNNLKNYQAVSSLTAATTAHATAARQMSTWMDQEEEASRLPTDRLPFDLKARRDDPGGVSSMNIYSIKAAHCTLRVHT